MSVRFLFTGAIMNRVVMNMFRLLLADPKGRFYDHRSTLAVGRSGDRLVEILPEDMIELPSGASLVMLPGRVSVGMTKKGSFVPVDKLPGSSEVAVAVGALLPQGYTRTLLPAFRPAAVPLLPLLGYAAVGWREGRVWVAARLTDEPARWDPANYNTAELSRLVQERLACRPANGLLRHLARCALDYQCFTAQNIFYRRWEGGLPVSPACNANCLGCISRQPAECCPAPQSRITAVTPVEEAVYLAAEHLAGAPEAIISFGQGCEGEPSLVADTVSAVIRQAREITGRGTINMNSNAGHVEGIKGICRAGLDSIRVSLISAREDVYRAYYRPRDYGLVQVRRSIEICRQQGVHVALNLLVIPGLTDRAGELEELVSLITATGVNQVQLRNLNIDPDYLWRVLKPGEDDILGIPALIDTLKDIPGLAVGNFSKPHTKGRG